MKLKVYFLCTIVIDPDVDHYKKLKRVMKYTQLIIGLPLILSMEKSENINFLMLMQRLCYTNTQGVKLVDS